MKYQLTNPTQEGPYTSAELKARITEIAGNSWHWSADLCAGGEHVALADSEETNVVAEAVEIN